MLRNPMSGVFHVLANMSYELVGLRERKGNSCTHEEGALMALRKEGNFQQLLESVDFELLVRGQSNLKKTID